MGFWGFFVLFFHFIHAGFFPVQITEGFLGGGTITLPCGFDSYETICKIDTGLNITTIPLTAESAVFKSVGHVSHVSASGSTVSCDEIEVNAVSFNQVSVTGLQRVVRCPLPEGAQPIVGLDVLSQAPFGLVYSKSAISLNENENLDLNKNLILSSSGHILVDVLLNKNIASRAMVDTGAGVTYVSQKFYEKKSRTVLCSWQF